MKKAISITTDGVNKVLITSPCLAVESGEFFLDLENALGSMNILSYNYSLRSLNELNNIRCGKGGYCEIQTQCFVFESTTESTILSVIMPPYEEFEIDISIIINFLEKRIAFLQSLSKDKVIDLSYKAFLKFIANPSIGRRVEMEEDIWVYLVLNEDELFSINPDDFLNLINIKDNWYFPANI